MGEEKGKKRRGGERDRFIKIDQNIGINSECQPCEDPWVENSQVGEVYPRLSRHWPGLGGLAGWLLKHSEK